MLKTFAYHKPSPEGIEKIARIRKAFSDFLEGLEAHVPASRERSLAVTNLEQAAMWATKAVTHNDPGSTVGT